MVTIECLHKAFGAAADINQILFKAFVGTEMNDSFAAVALPSSLRCLDHFDILTSRDREL
jgi:hypothetical protein